MSSWQAICIILDDPDDQFHDIIRNEVKRMANEDIKQLEITEFNLTAEVIGKEKFIVDMM